MTRLRLIHLEAAPLDRSHQSPEEIEHAEEILRRNGRILLAEQERDRNSERSEIPKGESESSELPDSRIFRYRTELPDDIEVLCAVPNCSEHLPYSEQYTEPSPKSSI